LRQRVEVRGLAAEVLGLLAVLLSLIGLAEAVEVLRILLIGLLELGRDLVVAEQLDALRTAPDQNLIPPTPVCP
jgi:uncharacterized membrane protein YccF (DUF307 family)